MESMASPISMDALVEMTKGTLCSHEEPYMKEFRPVKICGSLGLDCFQLSVQSVTP